MVLQTPISRTEFENILSNYNIGTYVSSNHLAFVTESTVFVLNTTKGKYIVKIFEGEVPEKVDLQLRIMDLLTEKNFDVPDLIKTKNKKRYLLFKNKHLSIQSFFEGKHPEKLTNKEIIRLGKDVAELQILLKKINSKLKMKSYIDWIGDVKRFLTKKLNTDFKNSINALEKLDSNKLRKGLIHCDINPSNILKSEKGTFSIIDWGDINTDYYVFDLAVIISHFLVREKVIYRNQIKYLIKSYEEITKLNLDEKKALYYMIKLRIIGVIAWLYELIENHPDVMYAHKEIPRWNNRYSRFSKWKIEDFGEFLK